MKNTNAPERHTATDSSDQRNQEEIRDRPRLNEQPIIGPIIAVCPRFPALAADSTGANATRWISAVSNEVRAWFLSLVHNRDLLVT